MKLAVVAVLLAGCSHIVGEGPHIPDRYKGTVPITVVNAHDQPICEFHIWAGEFDDDNWLGTPARRQEVAPGDTRTYAIKPGTYHVIAGFCTDDQLSGVTGTEKDLTVTIDTPTTIALGARPTLPTHGEKLLSFTDVRLDGPAPVTADTPTNEECQPPGAKVASSQDCCDTTKYRGIIGENGQSVGMGYYCE